MREILFRGKPIGNAWITDWVYGAFCPKNSKGDIPCIIIYNDKFAGHWFEVDPETFGQYTGKKVKSGKVFEGDIGVSIDGLFLVCWDDDKAAFVMRFYDYPYETLYLEEMWDDAEIIGNIHDNPELIKEDSKK